MSSGGADVLLALKETLRYGLFLGTFAGTFVSVDEIITSLGGHRRHDFLTSTISPYLIHFFLFFRLIILLAVLSFLSMRSVLLA